MGENRQPIAEVEMGQLSLVHLLLVVIVIAAAIAVVASLARSKK
jgi:hypothetical protein